MNDKKARLVDLEELFKTWAWNNYRRTSGGILNWLKGKLKFSEATFDLKWDRVKIKPRKPEYTEVNGDGTPDQRIVIESEYENETSKDQTHSFRTERDTTSTATFVVRKGMKKGMDAKIEVPLPDEMLNGQETEDPEGEADREKDKLLKMATASFGNSLSLDVEEGNSVSKTLKWGVDTTITSTGNGRIAAKLEVDEVKTVYDLSVMVDIKGTIVAVIKNTRGKHVMTVEGDVATVLEDLRQTTPGSTGDLQIFLSTRTVSLKIQGKVIFRYGVTQRVKVADVTKGKKAVNRNRRESDMNPNLQ